MCILLMKGVSIVNISDHPDHPLLAAYLSAGNLLSQILSIDDRMEPPKGGRLIWPALNI